MQLHAASELRHSCAGTAAHARRPFSSARVTAHAHHSRGTGLTSSEASSCDSKPVRNQPSDAATRRQVLAGAAVAIATGQSHFHLLCTSYCPRPRETYAGVFDRYHGAQGSLCAHYILDENVGVASVSLGST